jgi:hypothetical protein
MVEASKDTVQGLFGGVGRTAGRKFAYVRWEDGATGQYTLSEFRRLFGKSATSLATGDRLVRSRGGTVERSG